jgi:triacylglycerol lipase
VLLVHGIGFRDFRYFNYWGRIPRELVRNGAAVYYGHQEAWGTIEDNGEILAAKIREICRATGCGKVNIIAHSKGGLDARYVISGLHMAPYVASLTTICTPHRGSALVDFLKRMPDRLYRAVCDRIDRYFKLMGDRAPETYRASWQLSPAFAKEFNENYPDADGVYYQSYGSIMKQALSSRILCIPYWILKKLDGPNDGLVTAESARWTNFHTLLENRYLRGISHADMIDLSRDDYRGFDVLEFYTRLVQELGEKGY